MSFKFGHVSIIGKPNVGKSSLLNSIINEKVSIVSPKPQTTRNKILGIYNDKDSQIVFIDTPGIFSANNELDRYMQQSVKRAVADVDVVLLVLDGKKPISEYDLNFIKSFNNPDLNIIVVVNKTDITTYEKLYPQLSKLNELTNVKHIIATSALKNKNIDVLIEKIKELLPEGERVYDEDVYTDKTVKFMVAELIREKTLWLLQDEIPHGIAVEILKFKESPGLIEIDADIVCERKSHKQIIIGAKGDIIKQIGTQARQDAERLLDKKIYLNLFVKVREDWRSKKYYVSDLGYDDKDE